ncbi:MAG TPA: bifunctional demethylmenaquinone methyltransferase/2-methoxy-6-polyprenyl-1,4-benzoquinol methylase UbiE [Candidatus Hydrogenedentes bacterium]|nr:bifunctional demethylmenaquinone methyltransferase/2-methoxy-6-polyprenyl-1,4-benzoquinol methylase UbiE [Candidatus Hydrogenedentota bacterium]
MSFQPTVSGPSRHQIWKMFDRIAPAYDRANRLLSMGTDRRWRAKLVALLPDTPGLKLVDLATGTGDVLLAAARERTGTLNIAVGADLSGGMLSVGREKIRAAGLSGKCFLTRGDALHLPFPDCWADAVTMAFGIRNTVDPPAALREMARILRPGGRALILEFSLPEHPLIRSGYLFYFRHMLPLLGGWIAGDTGAYRYLNRTVESFPQGETFISLMAAAGFARMRHIKLTFGIASLYIGEKTEEQTA